MSRNWNGQVQWLSKMFVKIMANVDFVFFGYIEDRLYAVVFTPREDAVHVISFRKANSREVKRYG